MKRIFIPSLTSLLFLTIIAVYIFSCRHDTINISDFPEIKFDTQVLPIFVANCSYQGCHDGHSSEGPNLTTYEGIMDGVVKGKPYSSRIYNSIIDVYNSMPPDKPLDINARSIIRLWIEQGALNTKTDTSTNPSTNQDTAEVAGFACYSRDIEPIINSNCSKAGCHATSNEEIFAINSYGDVRNLVVPGHPDNSLLYRVITTTGENAMPPASETPLTKANIDSIYSWILHGATNDSCVVICDTNKYAFSSQILPLISTNCTGCHSGSNPQKGVRLENYSTISTVASNGMLVGSITGNGYKLMPPAPLKKLSDCKITKVKKWVANGYPNNK